MAKEHRCPAHYWIIDSRDIGRCKYCGAIKDFGRALARWSRRHREPALRGTVRSTERRSGRRRQTA